MSGLSNQNNNTSTDEKMNRVKELLDMGKTKGTLTYKEIMDQLVEVELEPEQFEKILETLETMGVDVVNEIQLVDAEPEVEIENEDLDISVPEGVKMLSKPEGVCAQVI